MLDFQLLYLVITLTIIGVSWYIYSDFSNGVIRIYFTTITIITVIGMISLLHFFNELSKK